MVPSQSPSGEPTYMLRPSRNPSKPPSLVPTFDPKTGEPSFNPTNPPSVVYTKGPSGEPSILPTFHISEAPSEDNQGEQEGGSNRRRNIIIGVSAGLSAGLAAALFCYLRNKNDQPGYEPLAGDSLAGYDEHSLAGYDELSDYDLTELPKDLYPIREEASSRETQASADHDSQQSTSTWVSFVNQIPEFFGLTSSATVPDASEEEEIKVEIASIKSEARQPSIHNSQPHDEARLRHVPTQNNQEDLETGSVSSLSDSGSEHSTRRRTPRSRLRRAVPPTDEHTAVSYAPTNLGVVPQSGDSNRSNASRDYYPFQEARDRIARRLGGETLQDTHSQEDTTSDQGFEIAASGDISFTESRHADDDVNRFITKTNKHYLVGQLTDLIRDFIPKLEGDYQPEAESVFISAVNELIKPIEQADSSETRSRENQHTYEDLSEVITELLTLIEESSVASETQSQSSSVTVSSQLRELVVRLESIYAEPRDRKNTSTERQPAQHQAVAQSILGRADEARQRGYSRIDEESGRIQSPNYHQEALSGLPLFLEGSSSRTIPSGNESVRSDSS